MVTHNAIGPRMACGAYEEEMSETKWLDVELIFANGQRGPAKAAYVGEGWCDVIAPFYEASVRLWCRSDGSVHQFGGAYLAKPWGHYEAAQ